MVVYRHDVRTVGGDFVLFSVFLYFSAIRHGRYKSVADISRTCKTYWVRRVAQSV
jgi:hypothetical protein